MTCSGTSISPHQNLSFSAPLHHWLHQGMATYTKRGASWRAQVYRDGKRHSRTFNTRGEAKEWAESLEEDLDRGHKPGRHTFADAIEKYRDEMAPKRLGGHWEVLRLEAFLRDYPDLIRCRVSELNGDVLTTWKRARQKKVKDGTVLRELSLMQSVLEYARAELRWIKVNPVSEVSRPEPPKPRKRRVSDDEAQKICSALGYAGGEPQNVSQRIALAFLFAIETGMRAGEITSLTWDQVHAKHAHLSKTKNGDERDVPLSVSARELLNRLPRDADRVFNVDNGSRDKLFRQARSRAKIVGLNFHDSRHEATTRLARKLDVLDLARVIGHRDIKSLMIYYNPTADELADRLG